MPPFSPTGNSVWTGGFICLAAAFSGLPILTPIEIENLGRILIPDDSEIISGTVFWFSNLIGFANNNS